MMKQQKIYQARNYVFAFLGCVGLGVLFQQFSTALSIPFYLVAIVFLLCASWASHCPHCGEYLTFKRNWIGKFCKHCGKKIE